MVWEFEVSQGSSPIFLGPPSILSFLHVLKCDVCTFSLICALASQGNSVGGVPSEVLSSPG